MKLYDAERKVKEELQGIYEENEAANIAGLAIEHTTGYQKKRLAPSKRLGAG